MHHFFKTNHIRALLFCALPTLLTGCSSVAPEVQSPSAAPLHLRVLATHDLHGALLPTTYPWSEGRLVGGMAALSTLMDTLEEACECVTVRVDGGDQMQGTLESNLVSGASVVAAFNQLELDAAAVGNHELDWGEEILLSRQQEAQYPWLAANIFRKDNGERPDWTEPYTIVERGNIRIGIIGYATLDTPDTLRPATTAPYEFVGGHAGIRSALDAVWQQNPDFVIVVAHAGGECNAARCAGEMVELAAELPPGSVHMIAGGHDHSDGDGIVNAIPIVRAGSSGRAVEVVDLYRLGNGTRGFNMERQIVYVDEVPPDAAMTTLLAPYLANAATLAKEPVTTLGETLLSGSPEDRRLGYLIADAARQSAEADIGMQNPGGVRADLLSGPVTYGDVHRVLPFDNKVVRLSLTGLQLRQLVEQADSNYYFSNLAIDYNRADEPGNRVLALRFTDNTPVIDTEIYTLGLADFLADGGDGFAMLPALPRVTLGATLLDATLEYLRKLAVPVVLPTRTQ